jgi:multidrug efflux pump subunit AcrA (membrane-fusion protein)
MIKKTPLILILLLLSACNKEKAEPLLYEVNRQNLSIIVPAKGELFAAKATAISAPMSNRGPQNIAWLAPEFSQVKKGDVIARFDGESMKIESQDKQLELDVTLQEIIEKQGDLSLQLNDINKDIGLISQETQFAKNFTINDVRIRSKLEILDEMQNTEFLLAKEGYLQWQSESFSASSSGEMGLLTMKRQQSRDKIKQISDNLSQLEIKAPHDGLLTYHSNWRGEKPKAGQVIFPGRKIAELPDISVMKAKIFVAESEAINLVKDKKVTFALNAFSEQQFDGIIESVAKFSQSIKRGDPQKYFEIIITLNKQNQQYFIPGRKLEANIFIAQKEQLIIVPLQSIFTDKNGAYVYLYQNGNYTKKPVELGQTSLSHIEIISGLNVGHKIALMDMGNS